MGFVVTVVVISFVAMIAFVIMLENKKENAFSQALSEIADFEATYRYIPSFGNAGIAIDANRKKVAIVNKGSWGTSVFDATEINNVEAIRNNSSILKTNRGGQIAGAAVGGVLLGPVGLLLGGLSGSKRTVDKLKNLSIRIQTNNISKPLHEITFLDSIGEDPDSSTAKILAKEMETWHARLRALISA